MNEKKPKIFLILKIIGFCILPVPIIGLILTITRFGSLTNSSMIGPFMLCFGLFVTVLCLGFGFSPEMHKVKIKTAKYLQEDNKDDLTDIADNTADITSGAITKTAKAIKKGLKDTKYCKHCGKEIDSDARFCKFCGKEQ